MNFSMRSIACLVGFLFVLAPLSAKADNYTLDFDSVGNTGGFHVLAEHSFSLGAMISLDSVSFELAHGAGGDFFLALRSPELTDYFFMSAETDVSDGNGNLEMGLTSQSASSTNLSDVALYSFVESGGFTSWDDGFDGEPAVGSSFVAPSGVYNANTWVGGSHAAGNWDLFVADTNSSNVGALGNFTMNFTTAVPEPSSAVILTSVFGLGMIRRRRG